MVFLLPQVMSGLVSCAFAVFLYVAIELESLISICHGGCIVIVPVVLSASIPACIRVA